MKRILSVGLLALATAAGAQNAADPVLMRINGTPVTRAEFEYSYNKNDGTEGAVEQKTVEEYAEMFINYKLKVAAALEARLDTTAEFKDEFYKYRDMQLTPYMVDEVYIDSVARDAHAANVKYIGGRDLIYPAHILLMVKQNTDEAGKQAVRHLADSICDALKAGADFAQMAKKYSQDFYSAGNGGKMSWMAYDERAKEFCDAAYKLQPGETSGPVEASYGYHIIHMLERRPYGSYDEEKVNIIPALKQQGIEEKSAEARIDRLVAQSNGRLTREQVLDSVLTAHLDNPELKYLVQEYHDGLLLFQMSQDAVWNAAKADEAAQEALYKSNKKKYAWSEPRFKGFVIHAKDKKLVKQAAKLLKKEAAGDWKKAVKQTFNKDSICVVVSGPYLCKAGENRYVDGLVFGKEMPKPMSKYPFSGISGKKLKQPASYLDVKSDVENDLMKQREDAWVAGLRQKYSVVVDKDVLATVNKH